MIYFIKEKRRAGRIKIGFSRDPRRRLLDLQAATSIRLFMLGVIPSSTFADEGLLHLKFKSLRVTGEWFRDENPLRSFVKKNAEKVPVLFKPEPKTRLIRPVTHRRLDSRLRTLIEANNAMAGQNDVLKKKLLLVEQEVKKLHSDLDQTRLWLAESRVKADLLEGEVAVLRRGWKT